MFFSAERAFKSQGLFPKFQHIRQEFPRPKVEDIESGVFAAVDRLNLGASCRGKRIAITAGSRGISDLVAMLAALVRCLRRMGAEPFIVPAMGSHGGATAEGQTQVLANLGVTVASVGAPILSFMDVIEVGRLENGMPVYMDRHAAESDGIIIFNRVKPHTDFYGEVESGLAKIAVLGLGKELGAATVHSYGVEGLLHLMPLAARLITQKMPVLFGLASIENAYHEVASVTAVPPEGIGGEQEKALLRQAYAFMPRFPFPQIDVLIVEQIGKNISGVGMDPNVTGRVKVHGVQDNRICDIRTIAALDLTPEAHGNASGIGLADVTTKRLVEQIDFEALYINCITAGICGIQRSFIPLVAPTDYAAIQTALRVCGQPDPQQARVVRIRHTLALYEMDVSECLLPQIAENALVTQVGAAFSLEFAADGRLMPFGARINNQS